MIELEETGYTTALCCVLYNKTISLHNGAVILLMLYGVQQERYAERAAIPVNPLLAYPVYLAGYIEQVGTGTTDIIDKCLEYGLKKPVFSQGADFSVTIWRKNHEKASNEIGKDGGNDIGNDGGKDALPDRGPNKNVLNLINVIGKQQLTLKQMMGTMSLKSSSSFHKTYLDPAINDGYVTKLYPDKPTSKGQAYLLTERGLKTWKKSKKK